MPRFVSSLLCLSLIACASSALAQPAGGDPEPPPLPDPGDDVEPPPAPPPPPDAVTQPPAQPPPAQPPPAYGPGYPPPAYGPGYPPPAYGQPGYTQPPPPPPRPNRTVRRHDRFYFRFAVGPAYGHVTSSGEESGFDLEATFEGWGPSYELLLGGTPGGGFVIGGGLLVQSITEPEVNVDVAGNASPSTVAEDEALGIVMLGPFFDWFPDPEAGGHVGAMIGPAAIGLEGDNDEASSGFGLALFGGYDFWVGDQWSLGPQARLTLVSAQRDVLGVQLDDTAAGFSLLFTALYH